MIWKQNLDLGIDSEERNEYPEKSFEITEYFYGQTKKKDALNKTKPTRFLASKAAWSGRTRKRLEVMGEHPMGTRWSKPGNSWW